MRNPANDGIRAALVAASIADDDLAAEAILNPVVRQLRQALTRGEGVACDCGRGQRAHAIAGAAVLIRGFDLDIATMLAVMLLAELHLAAPVPGFDLN